MRISNGSDVVILGSGTGGRGRATRLNAAGLREAMVESELVGGECPFWACVPSKALLRPAEATGTAAAVPDIPGLGQVEFWTKRQGTTFHELPASTVVLAVGQWGWNWGRCSTATEAGSRSSRRATGCWPERTHGWGSGGES